MSGDPAIQAALHGIVCRPAELRTDRNGGQFLQFFVRLGEGPEPIFCCIKSRRPDAIDRCSEFFPGVLVHAEGVLFINRKVNAAGVPNIVFDMAARHVRVVDIARRARASAHAAAAELGDAPS